MKKIIFILFLALAAAAQAETRIAFEQMRESDMPNMVRYQIKGGPFDGRYLFAFPNKAKIAMQIAEDISASVENANLKPEDLFDQNSIDSFKKAQETRCFMAVGKNVPGFFYLFNITLTDYADGLKRGIIFRVSDTRTKGFMDKQCRINTNKADWSIAGVMFAGEETGNIIIS